MATSTNQPQPNDLTNLIQRVLSDLSPSLHAVAQFALEQGANLAMLSVDEIAAECGVSKASVVRFCSALGFTGFRTFRQALIADQLTTDRRLLDSVTPQVPPLDASSSHPSMMLQALTESVAAAIRLTDTNVFTGAAEQMAKADCIVWYGMGDSGHLAASGNHRCFINRLRSRVARIPEELAEVSHQLTANDVLVCISRSGRLSSMVTPVRSLRESSPVPIIVITGDPGSPMAQLADYTLISAPIDIYIGQQRTTMQTAQMCMIDTLIAGALKLRHADLRYTGTQNLS